MQYYYIYMPIQYVIWLEPNELQHNDTCQHPEFPKHKPNHLEWSNLCVCKIYHSDVFGRGNIRKICTLPCWNLILYTIFCHILCDVLNNAMNFARKLFILFVSCMCACLCVLQHQKFFEILLLSNHSSSKRKIHYTWKDDFLM